MGRPRSFNETVVLEQAMKVFWQNGYFHTSIEMLTTGMGINRFSLYATFGSKDELFTRALRNYREQVISGLISALEDPDPDLRSIQTFFESLFRGSAEDEDRWGCLMVNTAAELSAHDHPACKEVTEYRDYVTDLFRRALEGAVRKDQIDQATDVKGTASYLFGLLLGFSVYAKCAPDVPALRAYLDQGLGPLTVDVAGR